MFFNKLTLIAIVTASVGSVVAQGTSFTGVACHFDRNHLPDDFEPCGAAGCNPPVNPPFFPIALPSTLIKGADSCCSTFTITFNGKTVLGTYAYKSSALANTTNLVLDEDLFAQFADPDTVDCISPVNYRL